jgi:hypothetical protein
VVIIATEHRTCQERSDSHFSLQKPINIIGDAGLKTQDAEDSSSFAIQCLES